ncbi:MAG: hypothetical protein LBG06_06375 [Deltaproteobacteria bacterium]|jgi:hypothetical protein|nr:hypothetical protein [Deltaproteobacteria bacterium]
MTSPPLTDAPPAGAEGSGRPGAAAPGRAPAGPSSPPQRGAAGREREALVCERMLAYSRALRLEPREALRLVLSIMDEGPPELPAALDGLRAGAGLAGPEGILRLGERFPAAFPPVRRTPLAPEKL